MINKKKHQHGKEGDRMRRRRRRGRRRKGGGEEEGRTGFGAPMSHAVSSQRPVLPSSSSTSLQVLGHLQTRRRRCRAEHGRLRRGLRTTSYFLVSAPIPRHEAEKEIGCDLDEEKEEEEEEEEGRGRRGKRKDWTPIEDGKETRR